ncbi:hypothetical protein G6L29_10600 [Agrobacterium rhizogenes]|uniref:hypothetical protein n=1 Tax=Rhizobium rhizogenes TaxID=359 RepID=UPI001573B99B|nr:hypothetical protein [Rhizobium rhizogenes]NTI16085.1 hypothetical protein [Rhizobium rhizogenes]
MSLQWQGKVHSEVRSTGRLKSFAASDYGPAALLLLLSILIAGVTQWLNPTFLTEFNLTSIGLLTAVLALAAFAQLFVMLTGGIDLSVAPGRPYSWSLVIPFDRRIAFGVGWRYMSHLGDLCGGRLVTRRIG